jgi:hypothetical protein
VGVRRVVFFFFGNLYDNFNHTGNDLNEWFR